jgi:hypothetical protein
VPTVRILLHAESDISPAAAATAAASATAAAAPTAPTAPAAAAAAADFLLGFFHCVFGVFLCGAHRRSEAGEAGAHFAGEDASRRFA